MIRITCLSVAVLLLPGLPATARNSGLLTEWNPQARYHYGFIFPHTPKVDYLVRGHVQAFDITLVKTQVSDNIFDRLFNYPDIGFGFFHAGLNNPGVLGSANSLISYLNAPVIRTGRGGLRVDYQITAGLSYLTDIFHLYDNNLNIAIGSHINLHFSALMDLRWKLSGHFEWTAGLSFSHFSNGRVELPNLGLNYISAFTGLRYSPGQANRSFPARDIPGYKKHFEHILVLSMGVKQYQIEDDDYYLIQSLSYDLGRRLKPHMKISAGADLFFDGSARNHFKDNGIDYGIPDLMNLGSHAGWHLSYRRMTMLVMLGTYLVKGSPTPSPLYSRLGLQYRCSRHILANVSLKSHNAIADFVEWGVGYSF